MVMILVFPFITTKYDFRFKQIQIFAIYALIRHNTVIIIFIYLLSNQHFTIVQIIIPGQSILEVSGSLGEI